MIYLTFKLLRIVNEKPSDIVHAILIAFEDHELQEIDLLCDPELGIYREFNTVWRAARNIMIRREVCKKRNREQELLDLMKKTL